MTVYPTDNEKRALLEGRLRGFAYDAYGHELNRQVAVAAGNTEAVQVAERALAEIAVATATYEQELASLPVLGPTQGSDQLENPSDGTILV